MKTLFRYIAQGQHFTALNGGKMIRRKPDTRRFATFCFECSATVGANAISAGVKLADATELTFVHMCPNDYVFVDDDAEIP